MSKPKNGLIAYSDGAQSWYQNDQLHRLNGPAYIGPDGMQRWYQNNQLHRKDGPACTYSDGSQYWYQNDRIHREDGPAEINPDGSTYWWIKGNKLSNPVSSYLNELLSKKRGLYAKLNQTS